MCLIDHHQAHWGGAGGSGEHVPELLPLQPLRGHKKEVCVFCCTQAASAVMGSYANGAVDSLGSQPAELVVDQRRDRIDH